MSAQSTWIADPGEFRFRRATQADQGRLARFLASMDRQGLYERHFAHGEEPNLALLRRTEQLDHRDRVAILALNSDNEVVGHGEYVAQNGAAEFALMVLPLFRARGIGKRLVKALLDTAAAAGQHTLHGMIQATNLRALKLALNCGLQAVPGEDPRVVIVSRALTVSVAAVPDRPVTVAVGDPLPLFRHDTYRTPLHRRFGPRAPLRARGRQVQRIAADPLGSREKARRRARRRAVRTQFGRCPRHPDRRPGRNPG